MSAILLSFGSAVCGAIIGAWLTRLWTPSPVEEIAALHEQVAAFQKKVEALEQERVETDDLPFFVSLREGAAGWYVVDAKNDSEEEITVEAISLAREGVDLSGPGKPGPKDDWRMPPGSRNQFAFAPPRDAVTTLRYMDFNLGPGTPIRIHIVLACKIRGKPRTLRRARLMTCDTHGDRMSDFSPPI